jgi:hypothetical protein
MILVRDSFFVICSLLTLVLAAGCENGGGKGASASGQIGELTTQKTDLQSKLAQTQAENERLKKQNELIGRLGQDKRAEAIYHLKAVEIGRFTNLYDENKDGVKEKLIVYVQPIDEVGDAIKAAGAVDVQLWDLNKEESKALISQWRIEPNELKKLWLESMMSTGYRLSFDITALWEKIGDDKSGLTVKISFTDYLSGVVFTEQKAIKPTP